MEAMPVRRSFPLFFLLASLPLLAAAQDENDPAALLAAMVPQEEEIAAMKELVIQLGSEVYKERKEASDKLDALPSIPAEVLEVGLKSRNPEVRKRMRQLAAKGVEARASGGLDRALKLIVKQERKDLFGAIHAVLNNGVKCDDLNALERACMTTATPKDLELIKELVTDPSAPSRLMAAAGAQNLPNAGPGISAALLKDPDSAVLLRAAITAGNLGQIDGARALGKLLAVDDSLQRVRAWTALRSLTGKQFDFNPLGEPKDRAEKAKPWINFLAGGEVKIVAQAKELTWKRLFNGRDLTGWTQYRQGVAVARDKMDWTVKDGVLRCPGTGPGDLRTDEYFADYVLLLKYRANKRNSDGGVGLMLTKENEVPGGGRRDGGNYLEVQILPGRTADLYVIGQFNINANGKKIAFSQLRSREVKEKLNEWQEMRVEVADGAATVFLKGLELNRAEGGPVNPGRILLREERFDYEFKDITLLPLDEDEEDDEK